MDAIKESKETQMGGNPLENRSTQTESHIEELKI